MPDIRDAVRTDGVIEQQRRGPAADWTAVNPILRAGEIGVEVDTGKIKVGDGATAWTALPYLVGSGSGTPVTVDGVTVTSADFTTSPADADLRTLGVSPKSDLDAHLADTSAAHAASAISFTPTGTIASTDLQAALAEVASEATGGSSGSLTPTQIRDMIMPFRGAGVLARTADPAVCSANTAIVAGVYRYLGAIRMYAGEAITNIVGISSSTAGASLTEQRMFLCDTSGVVLARSGDGGASWTANTEKVFPLLAAYTPGADATGLIVYGCAGTTAPNMPATPAPVAGALAASLRQAATWGGNSTDSAIAGSFKAVGATIGLPSPKAGISLAYCT